MWKIARMPSRRHELLARVVPKLRKSRELDSPEAEKARLVRWHATLDRTFPTRLPTPPAMLFSFGLPEELACSAALIDCRLSLPSAR